MDSVSLHYIHDPLCGCCYGAAPLLQAARRLVPVVAHAGGMMAGASRRQVTPQLRGQVMPHDRRIAELSGQPFGAAYTEGLLRDASAILDSGPPITAVLAADKLAGRGLDLLARLQNAHYVDGRRIADAVVLVELAAAVGIERIPFIAMFEQMKGEPTQSHIAQSRALLQRLGGQGFPTFAFEQRGRMEPVDIGPYLGRPSAWTAWLGQRVAELSG